MNKYVGVFDSGLGGLTVVKAMKKTLNENIVYLADSKNMPYGNKTNEQIISYSLNNVSILNTYGIKAIVIACNTSDSISKEEIAKQYDLPVFGVIKPASKKASELTKNNKVGVLATSACINSKQYEMNIKSFNENIEVFPIACPKLVPLIEDGKFNLDNKEMENTLLEYLQPLKENNVDTIVLGCTHYDLLFEFVQKLMPNVNVVSSSRCVIEDVNNYLKQNNLENKDIEVDEIYLATANSEKLNTLANTIINNIKIKDA